MQNRRAIPLLTLLVVRAAQNISELLPTPARNDRIRVLSHRDTSKYPMWLKLILKNKHDCHTGTGHENDRKLIIANPPELHRGKMAGPGFWPDIPGLQLATHIAGNRAVPVEPSSGCQESLTSQNSTAARHCHPEFISGSSCPLCSDFRALT